MKGMSQIVKVIAELVKDFIILFGIYIILNGHLSPG
ncbi:MAG: sodium:proton antiporter, partial [Caldisericia bacterium]|nr:sodium:proton antiporter [Caldisericia bacterium]